MHVTLSNRVEHLYDELKQQLFGQKTPCFRRRLVIVPSPAMKAWLMLRLAQDPDIGIAAGMEVVFLEPGISHLSEMLFEHKEHQPSTLEMALKIEIEIRNVISSNPYEADVWDPLLNYLKAEHRQPLSRRSERRLVKLSETLACLFREYGRYGGEMLLQWEEGKSNHWQQKLWRALFKDQWTYPYREFAKEIINTPDRDTEVFLFAISFLSTSQHRFFKKISRILPVQMYLLSPCLTYWADIRSDRESKALHRFWKKKGISQREEQALEEFLRDRNPLLANFGRLGRHMAEQIEDFDEMTTENYSLPHALINYSCYEERIDYNQCFHDNEKSLSLLSMVQADIALLRNPSPSDKITLAEDDMSIQVHISSSRLREVQNLYDTLMRLIERHREEEDPLTPSEIVVMAPNIVEFEPYIRAVFEAEGSVLGCQIMDLTVPLQSRIVQGFLHLLNLPSTRWEASALLHLFEHPAFQRKQGLTREEVRWIREWTKEAGIRWGKSTVHRSEVLEEAQSVPSGTWEHGFDMIIRSLVSSASERYGMLSAISIEASQSPTLGKFIQLIRALYADLAPLNNGSSLALDEWSAYLECLLDAYFAIDYQEGNDEEERVLLRRHIGALRHANRQLGKERFTFTSIRLHLTAALEQEQVSYREHHLQAVRFCSMLPMRAIPSKVVALIGMEEGAFPKRSSIISLDYLRKEEPVDYCPSQTDYDRYLFLEMLLSARHTFILSYCSAQQQPPSTLVAELISYLDNACLIGDKSYSKCRIYEHPYLPYDRRYFDEDSTFKSYSETRFKSALAFYTNEKIPSHQFLESIPHPLSNDKAERIQLNIRQLSTFAKNPLKTYFNHFLNMYINEKIEGTQDEDEIVLTHIENAVMTREGLKRPLESIFHDAERRGLFPHGLFKELAQDKITADYAGLLHLLQNVNVKTDALFEIIFLPSQEMPERVDPHHYYVPSLLIEHKGRQIEIVGSLPLVSSEGLIAFVEDTEEDIFKAFPEFILLCCAIKQYELPILPCIIPAKSNKGVIRQLPSDDPFKHLTQFLDFFFEGLQHPCPVEPDWLSELIKGSHDSFSKKVKSTIDNDYQPLYNPYLCWIAPSGDDINSTEIHNRWKTSVTLVYGDSCHAWYPEKEEKVMV